MRALQVTELTGPAGVRVVDVAEPTTPAGGILVEVHAVGLSFPDLLRSQGLYQERSDPPYTLGAELAGVVIEAAQETGLRSGDRIATSTRAAAAERAIADSSAVFKLPTSMSFEEGSALPLNYRTAILGLEVRGRLRDGETVLVHGAAGGTGSAAIQVARARQCRTIAVVSSDAKEEAARRAGADEVLRSDGNWKDAALQLTGGRGVDVVWDPVGGDRVLDTMRVLAQEGRWVVIGFTGGPIPTVPLNRILLRNIDVVGSYIGGYMAHVPDGARRLTVRLAELVESGQVQPLIGSVHHIERGADALHEIAGRQAIGKIVISIP
jgi:NADPH:quinone reductase